MGQTRRLKLAYFRDVFNAATTEGLSLMIRNLLDHPINLAIVVLVIVVLVGWKKMPDAARSLGRSMRIFKSEVEEMKKDGKPTSSAASSDTVKGETVNSETAQPTAAPIPEPTQSPSPEATADPIQDPTKKPVSDPTKRE
jgi:sec-independent protein translocase protein TatA